MKDMKRALQAFARTTYQKELADLTAHQLHHVLAQAVMTAIAPPAE